MKDSEDESDAEIIHAFRRKGDKLLIFTKNHKQLKVNKFSVVPFSCVIL